LPLSPVALTLSRRGAFLVQVGQEALVAADALQDVGPRLAVADHRAGEVAAQHAVVVGGVLQQPLLRHEPGERLDRLARLLHVVLLPAQQEQLPFRLQEGFAARGGHRPLRQEQPGLPPDRRGAEQADEPPQHLHVLLGVLPAAVDLLLQLLPRGRPSRGQHGGDAAGGPDLRGHLEARLVHDADQFGPVFQQGEVQVRLQGQQQPPLALVAAAQHREIGGAALPPGRLLLLPLFRRGVGTHLRLAQLLVLLQVLLARREVGPQQLGQGLVQLAAGAALQILAGLVGPCGPQVVDGAQQVALVQAQLAALVPPFRVVGVLFQHLVQVLELDLQQGEGRDVGDVLRDDLTVEENEVARDRQDLADGVEARRRPGHHPALHDVDGDDARGLRVGVFAHRQVVDVVTGGAAAGGHAGGQAPHLLAVGQRQGADVTLADDEDVAGVDAGQVQILLLPLLPPQLGAVAQI
jgi:hypothetical protein